MTIQTNVTNRKDLAQALALEIGAEVHYRGVPSCAYQVGAYTINRDSSITGEAFEPIHDFLLRYGCITEEPNPAQESETETASSDEPEETNEETDQEDFEADEKAFHQQEEITEVSVTIPENELSPTMLTNLLKLLYAKQDLIAAMTRSDLIRIDSEVIDVLNDKKPASVDAISELLRQETEAGMITGIQIGEGHLTLGFHFDAEHPTNWITYSAMIMAIVNRAKNAAHVNAKRIVPEESEMKYWCHSFLIQLGFRGPAHKDTRNILLSHLSGYAAFKTPAQMDAHKAKFTERRRAARLQQTIDNQETTQQEPVDSEAHAEEAKE